MGDIRSPTHPHSHVLSIKTWVLKTWEVVFLEKEKKEKKEINVEGGGGGEPTRRGIGKKRKEKKKKREGRREREGREEGFLYFDAAFIICSDQGAFMV